MKNMHLHLVTVEYKNYEILSADTDFYAFIGQERFYNTFIELLHPSCQNNFKNKVESKSTEPFVAELISENGEKVITYISISYEKDTMSISLEALSELCEGQEFYHKLSNIDQDLLGLHNDIIFTYDRRSEIVKLYSADFRRCIKEYKTDEFLQEIKSNIDENEYPVLEELKSSLSMSFGSFTHNFTGNIVNISKECKKSIVKGIMIDGADDITAVGYIHRSSSKNAATFTVEKDALTGVYAKQEIANLARKAIDVEKKNIALCIMDIDYFKKVNDNYGHMRGDQVIKEVADIIRSEVGNNGAVGRFGGDEFLVAFYDVDDMNHYREKLRSIRNRVSVKYASDSEGEALNITLSIGCAIYPRDASNYEDVFALADYCLYVAKDKGRNRYIIYEPEKHGSIEEIKNRFNNNRRIDSRKDLSIGDVLCMIQDKHYGDKEYTPEMLVDDLVENTFVERIVCYGGTPLKCRCMAGNNLASLDVINSSIEVFNKDFPEDLFQNDMIIINNIERMKNIKRDIYDIYNKLNIKSCIMVRFYDAQGKFSLLSLEMTTKHISWNENQTYNYRMMARMFSRFVL